MNVEDATAYTEKLLAMTDDQYTEYMALWQRKQQEAQAIAQTFYQDEMDALGKEFVDKIPQELGDVKDEMRSIGVQGIQGMIDGMYSRSGALWSAAASIVSQAIAAMRAAADINSPSRVTENLVGKPLAQGIEVGFLDTMARVSHRMADTILTPFQSVTRGDLLDAAAGVVNGNAADGIHVFFLPHRLGLHRLSLGGHAEDVGGQGLDFVLVARLHQLDEVTDILLMDALPPGRQADEPLDHLGGIGHRSPGGTGGPGPGPNCPGRRAGGPAGGPPGADAVQAPRGGDHPVR